MLHLDHSYPTIPPIPSRAQHIEHCVHKITELLGYTPTLHEQSLLSSLHDLQAYVSEKSKTIDYQYHDYPSRLALSPVTVEKYRKKLNQDPKLSLILTNIRQALRHGDHDPERILTWKDNLLEDLTLESIPEIHINFGCADSRIHFETNPTFFIETMPEYYSKLGSFWRINLSNMHLDSIPIDLLKEVFERANKVKSIHISQSDLSSLDPNKLRAIFSGFRSLEYLELCGAYLHKASFETLTTLSEAFSQLKGIKFSEMITNPEAFGVMLQHAQSLRYLNLGFFDFSRLTPHELLCMFGNLPQLIALDWTSFDFSTFTSEQIKALAPSFGKLRHIGFFSCRLHGVSETNLDLIFSSLTNVKHLTISGEISRDFLTSLGHRYPHYSFEFK